MTATAALALALGLSACSGGSEAPETTDPPSTTAEPSETTPEPTETTPEPTETAPEPTETTPEPTEEAPPSAEDINGRWCATPESATPGCVSIALPNATYDDGMVVDIAAHGSPVEAEGGFSFSMSDAPFGTYYPAGVAIPGGTPDYYAGTDLPDEDRVWNSQTGTMLVRDES